MTSDPVPAPADFRGFLAEDFARMDAVLLDRCGRLHGKRLYLSGATGFFGKNLLALFSFLGARGASFEVHALSRSPDRFLAAQPWCRSQPWLRWVEGDARETWRAEGTFDLVLHAATDTAAAAHRDKLAMFDGVIAATRNALEFAVRHGADRLLLCGSGAQYGAIAAQAYAEESSNGACDPTVPSSAYGEAKRVSEMLAALHAERHGFAVVNTRSFAFVGPGLPLDGHFAIGNFIGAALAGGAIKLSSTGDALRSYLYGADLAVWLVILLLEAPGGSTINVGSDHALTILELAGRVRDLVNAGAAVEPGTVSGGGERSFYVPRIERARAMGLDVFTDLDQAIHRTAKWHRLERARNSA
jgi:nucleoside-diphosphate-sugar epimerase